MTVKQQLLNYFMDEQRKLAVASTRLSLGMIIDQMNAPSASLISKLSHTALVGNHQLEIKADPLRTGFMFSDSDREMTHPKIKFPWPSWLVAAGVIVGLYGFFSQGHGAASAPPPAAVQQVATRSGRAAGSGSTRTTQCDRSKSGVGLRSRPHTSAETCGACFASDPVFNT